MNLCDLRYRLCHENRAGSSRRDGACLRGAMIGRQKRSSQRSNLVPFSWLQTLPVFVRGVQLAGQLGHRLGNGGGGEVELRGGVEKTVAETYGAAVTERTKCAVHVSCAV